MSSILTQGTPWTNISEAVLYGAPCTRVVYRSDIDSFWCYADNEPTRVAYAIHPRTWAVPYRGLQVATEHGAAVLVDGTWQSLDSNDHTSR